VVNPRRRAERRLRATCFHILVSLTYASVARAEGPPCLTQVEVAPPRAVVGQQVAYLVRVLRRPDVGSVGWVDGLSFPSFRAEWLPGQTGHLRQRKQGTPYLVYEERRALFAMRAGRLEIPQASLSCTLYAPPGGTRESVAVNVPASFVDVDEPPEAERPRSWSGLVGPVDVKLAVEPQAVALGDTVRVTVTLAGDGNLWAAPAPLGDSPFEGGDTPEVFARTPELSFDPGEVLHVRRVFAFELVPRHPGRFVIAAYELSFFDPKRKRFAVSKTEPVEVVVAPQAAGSPIRNAARAPFDHASSAPPASPEPRGGLLFSVVLGALAFLGAGCAAFLLRRNRGTPLVRNRLRAALRAADRARRAGDVEGERRALVHAVRAGLERALLSHAAGSRAPWAAGALSADELAERAQGDPTLVAAAEILRAEERARFAEGREGPESAPLRAAAEALSRHPGRPEPGPAAPAPS